MFALCGNRTRDLLYSSDIPRQIGRQIFGITIDPTAKLNVHNISLTEPRNSVDAKQLCKFNQAKSHVLSLLQYTI
jgi:hypothetical protein